MSPLMMLSIVKSSVWLPPLLFCSALHVQGIEHQWEALANA